MSGISIPDSDSTIYSNKLLSFFTYKNALQLLEDSSQPQSFPAKLSFGLLVFFLNDFGNFSTLKKIALCL